MAMNPDRRNFLKQGAGALGLAAIAQLQNAARCQAAAAQDSNGAIVIDPKPLFDLSPHLYMQFMEPLGTTDSSVEAAWSYDADTWRQDFIDATKDLAPGMMRYGGLLSRYYKWREGVGPPDKRPLMRNYLWGGKETNRVGTHEFVDFCRKVNSEPLYCVNFLSDGRLYFGKMKEGNRTGDAQEAADWVSYANDPQNVERKSHGVSEPYSIKYWQLGNETSYGPGGFTKEQSIDKTIEFAKAMRQRDPSIKLIGWGDTTGGRNTEPWAGDLVERAGEFIDYVAIHMMQQSPMRKNSVLNGLRYQESPREAWDELMEMSPRIEAKLVLLEQALDARKSKHPLAVTEGHLSLEPRNINPILTEWLTGVYHARAMNIYQRHGDRVKIATAADFCGSRWTTNALMIQVPGGVSYLLPAGAVMRLFKKHNGSQAVAVKSGPNALDIAASSAPSGDGQKIFLHIANMDYAQPIEARFAVNGMAITNAIVHEIAPESPRQAITERQPDVFAPKEHILAKADVFEWRFPARSVSAVELSCKPATE
jgi:alpha-L-arabinofuranosidase